MDKRIKKKWIKALRSGEYAQGRERLCRSENGVDQFCCLGVLCELHAKETGNAWSFSKESWSWTNKYLGEYLGQSMSLPKEVLKWAGLPDYGYNGEKADKRKDYPEKFEDMNDGGMSFKQIAKYIEKNL